MMKIKEELPNATEVKVEISYNNSVEFSDGHIDIGPEFKTESIERNHIKDDDHTTSKSPVEFSNRQIDIGPEIETEPIEPKPIQDNDRTTSKSPAEFSDGQIDIGPEFKTEPIEPKPIQDDDHTTSKSTGRHLKLIYCPQCDKTCEYLARKGTSCRKCNTALKYKCEKCMKLYGSIRSLSTHISQDCQYKTNVKPNLASHIETKHSPRDSNRNECRKCKKKFAQQRNLSKHSKICGMSESEKRSLMRYSCDHCQYKTLYKEHLTSHIRLKHLPRDPSLNQCSKCRKTYSCHSALQLHLKLCGQTDEFKRSLMRFSCDHCQYKTNTKQNLSTHNQAKHLPKDPNLNRCEKCGRSYSSRPHLVNHSKICGKPKNSKILLKRFGCDHCPYRSDVKYLVARHIQAKHLPRHANSNKCTGCGKAYSNRGNLQRHLKICGQTEDLKRSSMRFICDHCQYKTNYKGHLAEHIQLKHLSRHPNLNKCEKCGKNYSCRSVLQQHLKMCGLTKELKRSLMRFTCDHCPYKAYVKSKLALHIQRKHLPRNTNSGTHQMQ